MTTLERRLRAVRPPDEAEAERRAWKVVRAAHASREPVRRQRRMARFALAAAAAVVMAALALSPAGAKMGDWIADVVDPGPEATRSLSSLPASGRLLVVGDRGAWIVGDDGARRHLRGFGDATWSPGGLFLAAARGKELVALDPQGRERWTRPASGRVAVPRWSPDGYRVAYRTGAELRVAFGDNADDWLLASPVAAAAPAWKPVPAPGAQVLAFATPSGAVRIVEVDTRVERGRTPPGPAPREIWWGRDGQRLVTVGAHAVRVHGRRGRLLRTVALPDGLTATGSAIAPGGKRLAVIAQRPGARPASELLLMRVDRAGPLRSLLSMPGTFEGLSWSIDGSLLVVGRPGADQWLYVRPGGSGRLQAVQDIRDRFAGGARPRTGAFPRPAGWCYAEPANRTASGQPPCSAGAGP